MNLSVDQIRMFVHVLAAVVWVGGQLTLAGLVPVLRPLGQEVTRAAANRFALLAWPAFAVLTFTGIWNAMAMDVQATSDRWKTTFGIKMTCYLITGGGAALHSLVKKRWALALGGAMAGLGAVAVLFCAVALRYQ